MYRNEDDEIASSMLSLNAYICSTQKKNDKTRRVWSQTIPLAKTKLFSVKEEFNKELNFDMLIWNRHYPKWT